MGERIEVDVLKNVAFSAPPIIAWSVRKVYVVIEIQFFGFVKRRTGPVKLTNLAYHF